MRPLKILRSDGLFRYKELKKKQVIKIILALFLSLVVIGAAFFTVYAVSRSMTAEESDEKTGELQADATTVMTIARGEFCSLLLPDEVDINDVAFTSSDERIIRVDAAGRVEGRAEGDAVVTAASEDFTASCNFRVKGEKKTPEVTEVTTAYTANADILAENIKEGKTNRLYRITVNRRTNTVTVFTYDKDGKYTVPVRAMVCSCGAGGPNITPVGEYRTASSREWAALYGDEWTLHYSLVTGMDIPNGKVYIANPYGYYEEISVDEFLSRTSFTAYTDMPWFLKMGFAFGIFEKNTIFTPK